MEIYRFKVIKNWYAFALRPDAEDARDYFLKSGYPPEMVGTIEKAQDGQDFEFKLNSIQPRRFSFG